MHGLHDGALQGDHTVTGLDFDEICQRLTVERYAEVIGAGRGRDSRHFHCPLGSRHTNGDENGSLWIFRGEDGGVGARCYGCDAKGSAVSFAAEVWGCTQPEAAERLVRELGLHVAGRNGRGLTLGEFAHFKCLPVSWLKDHGVSEARWNGNPAVAFDYRNSDGSLFRVKYRTDRTATDGSSWGDGRGTVPFGLDRLADEPPDRPVVLCEGESDTLSLWKHGLPALGIPGATNWKPEFAEYVTGRKLYVWQEPDEGGEKFVDDIVTDLPDALVIISPEGMKDASDLHMADPEAFGRRFTELVEAAKTRGPQPKTFAEVDSGDSGEGFVGDWPEPIEIADPKPDPIPIAGLPDWVRDEVENIARHTQTAPELALGYVMPTIHAALANKVVVDVVAGYEEPLQVWFCTVAESGTLKSPANKLATEPIKKREVEVREAAAEPRADALDRQAFLEKKLQRLNSLAGKDDTDDDSVLRDIRGVRRQLDALEVPANPTLNLHDVTSERLVEVMAENDDRIAIIAPEGGPFRLMDGRYQREGSVDIEPYKYGWTGNEPYAVQRMKRMVTVHRPAITMGVSVQPGVFATLRNRQSLRSEGLFARFLYIVPPDLRGARLTGRHIPPLDEAVHRRYAERVAKLFDAEPSRGSLERGGKVQPGPWEPARLTLSGEALEVWDPFCAEVEEQFRPDGLLRTVLPDWGSKLRGQVIRLAAGIHVAGRVDHPRGFWSAPITGQAMQAAVGIGRALISHARAVFEQMETDPVIGLARYVLQRIQDRAGPAGHMSQSDLLQLVKWKRGLSTADDLRKILNVLEGYNLVRVQKLHTGARPTHRVFLHPRKVSPESQERGPEASGEGVSWDSGEGFAGYANEQGPPSAEEPASDLSPDEVGVPGDETLVNYG